MKCFVKNFFKLFSKFLWNPLSSAVFSPSLKRAKVIIAKRIYKCNNFFEKFKKKFRALDIVVIHCYQHKIADWLSYIISAFIQKCLFCIKTSLNFLFIHKKYSKLDVSRLYSVKAFLFFYFIKKIVDKNNLSFLFYMILYERNF